MKKPAVSICIANYNGIPIISECLDSVFAQQGNTSLEIIVHDDASTDESVEFLRSNYPDIRLIESESNVGFCVSNNRMAEVANGEYLLLLNNDAMLLPDAVVTLLDKAKEIHAPAILGLPQYDADSGELLDRGSLLDPFLNPIPNLDPNRVAVGMVMGACLWIPRSLWQELGGFPEWFGSIGEDLYLCSIARLKGYPVAVAPSSGYRHYVGRSFGGGKVSNQHLHTTYKRRALSERNKTYVMILCYPPSLLGLIPLHILLLMLEGLILSLTKLDWKPISKIYLPVFKACWINRKKLKLERARLFADFHISARAFIAPIQWCPYKLRLLLRYKIPAIT